MFKVYYKYNSNCSSKANEVAQDFAINHEDDTFDTEDDIYDSLYQDIDDSFIYTDDQWDLLKAYTTPSQLTESSLSDAFEELQMEAYSCLEIDEDDDEEYGFDDDDYENDEDEDDYYDENSMNEMY